MKVYDILREKGNKVYSLSQKDTICTALQIMHDQGIGALVVIDDNQVAGLITERNILTRLYVEEGNIKDMYVRDFMTIRTQMAITHKNEGLEELIEQMTNRRVRYLPVLEEERLLGLISIGDILKALMDEHKLENEHLKSYIHA